MSRIGETVPAPSKPRLSASGKPLDCVGIDLDRSQVGKHDFKPIDPEKIVHGPGSPFQPPEPSFPATQEVQLTRRTPESKERYYAERITELVMGQQELGRVTRERDALARGFKQIAAGSSPGGAEAFATKMLAKLESGELRKPSV